jgi:hypothetical protein
MSKHTALLLPLAFAALLLAGCGGGGSATPEGAANDVLSAIQSERFERIYRNYQPHNDTARKVHEDRQKFRSETTENWWTANREEIAGTGDNSLDPGKKLEIESEEDYFNLSPERRAALHDDWYKHSHRWEKFSDRVGDLRLTSIEERHGLEGDGEATVRYNNRYGDSLVVRVVRFRGTWYVATVRLDGRDKLPTRGGDADS